MIPTTMPDQTPYCCRAGTAASPDESKSVTWVHEPYYRPLFAMAVFLLFVLTALALHHKGFDSPMIYDSRGWIQNKASIYGQHDIRGVMGIVPARPLFMLTLYGNYLMAGMEPALFRVFNALTLAAAGLALVYLCMLLFRATDPGFRDHRSEAFAVSLVIGLWFVAHPLQTFVVLYIWQREAILGCLFYYSALAAYIGGRSGRFGDGNKAYVLTGVLFLAGMLCKENVSTLPLIIALAELIIFPQGLRNLMGSAGRIAFITAPALVVYLLITHSLQGAESVHTASITKRLAEYYEDGGIGPVSAVLTQCRVVFSYLGMMLKPSLEGLPLLKAEIISRSLVNPPVTLPAVLGLLGLLGLGVVLARRRPLSSFGILFFLTSLIPESLLLPQYPFCGYRAILPMAGVLIVVGDFALWVLSEARPRIPARWYVPLALACAILPLAWFSAVTFSQAMRWNPLLFWKDAYSRLPRFSDDVSYRPYIDILSNYGLELAGAGDSQTGISVLSQAVSIELGQESGSRDAVISSQAMEKAKDDALDNLRIRGTRGSKVSALVNLGGAWKRAGNPAEAMACYRKAVEVHPASAVAHNGLALALKESGNLSEAINHYRKALQLDAGFALAYNGLGIALEESGNLAGAVAQYRKAIELDPGLAEAHNNLGCALEKTGNVVEAANQYQKAIAYNPALAEARNNLGVLLQRLGDLPHAMEHLRKAVELDPSSATAHSNLAAAMEASGDPGAALMFYEKSRKLAPNSPDINYALANAMLRMGNKQNALTYFRKAVQLRPSFLEAHANLGLLLLGLGDMAGAIESLEKALAINGSAGGLRNALGVAYAAAGKRSEAVEQFRKALEIDPKDARAGQNLDRLIREGSADGQ